MRTALDFPKSARILRSADYRHVYDHGFRLPGPLFAAFCLEREGPEAGQGARLGITVPRAVGKATVRNRIKRRLREAFRLRRAEFQSSWDIVLNPRRSVADVDFPQIEIALGSVIQRCNFRS